MDCTEAYRDYNCASLSYVSEPRLKIFPVSEYEPLCGVFLSAISVKDFLRCLWGGFCLLHSCISCRCFSTLCFSGGLRCSLLAADFLRLWYSHSARSLRPFPQPHLAVLPVKGISVCRSSCAFYRISATDPFPQGASSIPCTEMLLLSNSLFYSPIINTGLPLPG